MRKRKLLKNGFWLITSMFLFSFKALGQFVPFAFQKKKSTGGNSFSINSSQNDVNLSDLASNPSTPGTFSFVVETGVVIGASTSSNAALSTGNFPAGSVINLTNNGHICGRGGNGGRGYDCIAGTAGTVGQPGGNAISLSLNLNINNTNGHIFGGGGGGGGGGATSVRGTFQTTSGSGGGGGQGVGDSSGGLRGTATGTNKIWGSNGTGGTFSAPGTRGGTGILGGNGGAWGSIGATGASGTRNSGRAGGAAGKAIATNGHSVVWQGGNNGSQVIGTVG